MKKKIFILTLFSMSLLALVLLLNESKASPYLTKVMNSGDGFLHGSAFANGSLWFSSAASPPKVFKMNLIDLSYSTISLPELDTANTVPDLEYAEGYIWVIIEDLGGAPSRLVRLNPDTLEWQFVCNFSSFYYGQSLHYDFGFLWIGGRSKIVRMNLTTLTYSMYDYSGIIGTSDIHAITSDNSTFILATTAPTGYILKINATDPYSYTYANIGYSISDDIAYAEGYLFFGTENFSYPNRIYRINVSNLTSSYIELSYEYVFGVVSYNGYIWACIDTRPGTVKKLDFSLNILKTLSLPSGYDSANEIVFAENYMVVTCYMYPAKIVRYNMILQNAGFALVNPSIGTQGCLAMKGPYIFQANVTDDGLSDVDYIELTLDCDGQNLKVRWTRSSDSFDEINDPNNYISVSGSSSYSDYQWTINFQIIFAWTYPDENLHTCRLYSVDINGLNDTDDYPNVYYVENDLVASGLSVSDYRCDPGQTLTFSGYWYYQGTSIPPPDGNYNVKIKLSGTQKGSTDTTLVSGYFSISDVIAESSVGSYSYTVEADYMASAGSFSAIIVDRLVVTISANTTNPTPNSYVSFTVTAVYDYDDSAVSSWTVNILRNSTHFAFGNFTDGGYDGVLYLYTTENVTENIYGLTAFSSNTVTVYWSTYVALTVQTKDLDGNILANALVYFNETAIAVDSNGYATKSEIVQYSNITVKVLWKGSWVNGTWTINMTTTQTVTAYCNVWSMLVIARDSESTLFSSSNLKLAWTFPGSAELLETSDGTWTFKTCNGTSYYQIKFFDVWVSANTSIALDNKNVTVLYVNCQAYPYTIGAAKYHWASNATATSYVWNSTSLLLQIEFGDSPDNYVLVSDAPRPTYLLNVTFNMPIDYASYLCLKHYGNTTITVSYENWGDFYIRSVQHRLSNVYWTGQLLTIIIEGEAGENGTLTVYCGSRGSPRQASSLTNPIYNADTKILSGTYVFSSTVTVTLDWTSETGGTPGGTTTVGRLEINVENAYLSLARGETVTFNLTIHWRGVNDIVVSKVTVTEEYVTWFSLAETLPKYGSKTSAETEGTVTVMLKVSVPWQITLGQHTIPITVTVSQEGGINVEKSGVIYLTVLSGAPSPAGIPEIMTYLFLATVIGLSSYAFLKKRR
ncbi:MAG: hypothetical protein QXR76_03445 [Candidatus Bathyarchaeia archaeon]